MLVERYAKNDLNTAAIGVRLCWKPRTTNGDTTVGDGRFMSGDQARASGGMGGGGT